MAKNVKLLHSSLHTQLVENAGFDVTGDPLWICRYNFTCPEAVIKSHLDFLRAGAQIILTNTYQASIEGFMENLKMSQEESVEEIKNIVQLAQKAREVYLQENFNVELPKIFASIGPLGAHLADGSEYTGNYPKSLTHEFLKKWHKVRIDAVIEAGVDGLSIETLPCLMEAEAIVDLILESHPTAKFWVSFQAKNGSQLAGGEYFAEAAEKIWKKVKTGNLLAVGLNCVAPKFVTPLFKSLNGGRAEKIPLLVWPNSGEDYSAEKGWFDRKEECGPIEDFVAEWIDLGVRYLGTCCRTNLENFRKIKEKLETLKNQKV